MVEVLAPACGDLASEPCAKPTTTGIGGEPTRFASILAAQQGAQIADIAALGASALAAEQSSAANPSLGKVLQESLESDLKLLLMASNLPLTAVSLQKKNSAEAEKSALLLAPPAPMVATNIIPITNALGIGEPQPLFDETPSDDPSQTDAPVEKSAGEPAPGQHINLSPQVIALLGPPMEKLPIVSTPSLTASSSKAAPAMENSDLVSKSSQTVFAAGQATMATSITAKPQPPFDESIFAAQPVLTDKLSAQPVLTDKLPAQPVLTDKLSAQPVLTDKLPAQPVLTDKLSAQPVLTNEMPAQPVLTDKLSAQPVLTNEMPAQPVLTNEMPAQPVLTDKMPANIAAARSDTIQAPLQNDVTVETATLAPNSQQAFASRVVMPSPGNPQGNPIENILLGTAPLNEASRQTSERVNLASVAPINPGEARPAMEGASLKQTLIAEVGEVRPQVVTPRRFTNAGGENSNDILNQLPQDLRIIATHTNAARGMETAVPQAEAAQAMRMIDQIVEKAQIGFTGGRNEIHIQLDPPELGRVQVKVSSDGGIVTTRIEVSMPEVRNLLEANMQQLRAGLEKANINIGQCSVSLTGEWGSRNMQAQQTPDVQIQRSALSHSEMQLSGTEQSRPRYVRDASLTLDYFA
jgi:flagellar hook-length control protein FliK